MGGAMNRRTLLGSGVAVVGAVFIPGEASGQAVGVRRSVRQWDEVLDLGDGRGVPLRRLHLEGIDPRSVRYATSGDGAGRELGWSESARDLREWYLLEEHLTNGTQAAMDRVAVHLGRPATRCLSLHAWWATAAWGGVVFHTSSVSMGVPVSKEGLRFIVGVEEFVGGAR